MVTLHDAEYVRRGGGQRPFCLCNPPLSPVFPSSALLFSLSCTSSCVTVAGASLARVHLESVGSLPHVLSLVHHATLPTTSNMQLFYNDCKVARLAQVLCRLAGRQACTRLTGWRTVPLSNTHMPKQMWLKPKLSARSPAVPHATILRSTRSVGNTVQVAVRHSPPGTTPWTIFTLHRGRCPSTPFLQDAKKPPTLPQRKAAHVCTRRLVCFPPPTPPAPAADEAGPGVRMLASRASRFPPPPAPSSAASASVMRSCIASTGSRRAATAMLRNSPSRPSAVAST
eukprot:358113-Chlamydomonas_euryale.AAC.8